MLSLVRRQRLLQSIWCLKAQMLYTLQPMLSLVGQQQMSQQQLGKVLEHC
jgi:hypothetical protein